MDSLHASANETICFMRRSLIGKAFIFSSLLVCVLAPPTSDAADNTNDPTHYLETPKLVEPLDVKKAAGLAQAFFKKRYPQNADNYFPAKMEYGHWTDNSHPYTWEVTYYPKPGHGITLGGLFWVMLLVSPDGKVSVEKDAYATAK